MQRKFSYHFKRGLAFYNNADFGAAAHEFSEAVKIDPRSLEARLYEALANEGFAVLSESAKLYSKIILLAPVSAQSYFARARLLLWTAQERESNDFAAIHAKAAELYSKVIGLAPDFSQAYYSRAEARAEIGNLAGALQDFNRVLELDPAFSIGYLRRSSARVKMGDLRGAIRDLESYLELPLGAAKNHSVMQNISAYWLQLSVR